MNRLRRSWELAGSSWAVLREDRELLVLPVVSALAALLCVAPFLGGAALLGFSGSDGTDTSFAPGIAGYALMFLGYLVGAYVTIFFQAALVHAANERLAGGQPTLGSALSGAAQRAGRILPWALLSATVSVVLRSIQERSGIFGRLVVGLIGMAWTLVTFLVLPIIVVEGTGTREALRRSSTAFKATWGENVAGNAGIGIVSAAAVLLGVLVSVPIFVVAASVDSAVLFVAGAVLLVFWVAVVAVVSAALSGVYQTALYRYAVLGEEPRGFSTAQINSAFQPRGSSRLRR